MSGVNFLSSNIEDVLKQSRLSEIPKMNKVLKELKEEIKVEEKPKLNIYGKILAIMNKVTYVHKDGKNTYQKYNYVSESNVAGKIREAMLEVGVIALPNVANIMITPMDKTKPDGSIQRQNMTTMDLFVEWVDVDSGESVTVSMSGQGVDSGDKGIYKAITGANKYVLMKMFQIPTGDDPEKHEQEQTTTKQPPEESKFTPLELVDKVLLGEKILLDAGYFGARKHVINARMKHLGIPDGVDKNDMAKLGYDKLYKYYKYLSDKYQRDSKKETK